MKIRALALDFDGVIADTEPLHFGAFQAILAEEGFSLTADEYYARYLGFDDDRAFRAAATDRGRTLTNDVVAELVFRKSRRMAAALEAGDVLFPGVAECVRAFATRLRLAVVSGALRREIEVVLKRAAILPCFQAIVAAGETPAAKPAPDPYLKAAAVLDVSPSSAVAVEDSSWGLRSARAAGFHTVAVTTSRPVAAFSEADLVLPDLTALTLEQIEELARPRR